MTECGPSRPSGSSRRGQPMRPRPCRCRWSSCSVRPKPSTSKSQDASVAKAVAIARLVRRQGRGQRPRNSRCRRGRPCGARVRPRSPAGPSTRPSLSQASPAAETSESTMWSARLEAWKSTSPCSRHDSLKSNPWSSRLDMWGSTLPISSSQVHSKSSTSMSRDSSDDRAVAVARLVRRQGHGRRPRTRRCRRGRPCKARDRPRSPPGP